MDIWSRPKYLPFQQPELTDAMIVEAETKMGVKLPKEYIEILKIQNGGYIRYRIPSLYNERISGIGPNYSSITDFEWLQDYDDLSFNINKLFPFDGDGHWNLCLDYRNNDVEPQITYIDTEMDSQRVIAESFKDFLEMMVINAEDNYVIETNLTLEEMINLIEEMASVKFDSPDSFSHGYPIYRCKFNESWVWISPNMVPSGFIREEDERYNELKSEMLNMTLRFPEIRETYLLISVSEESDKQKFFNILKENNLVINGLETYYR